MLVSMGPTDAGLMDRVRDELEAGSSLETIEHRIIDSTELDEERRSAAWLYAWSVSTKRREPRFAQRRSPLR
jgi:hypothetical protein